MAKYSRCSEESPLCKYTVHKNGQELRYVISADENKKMTPEARQEVLRSFWGGEYFLAWKPGREDWGDPGTKKRMCKMVRYLSTRRKCEKDPDRKQQLDEDVRYLKKLLLEIQWGAHGCAIPLKQKPPP